MEYNKFYKNCIETDFETAFVSLVDYFDEKNKYNRWTESDLKEFAKQFFELGLKTNQENNIIGTIEREVKIDAGGYPYINCDIEFYDYDKDIPLAKEGDKVKVVLVKGE